METLGPFISSSITWVGYEPGNKILYVQFVANDKKYEYEKVPAKKWAALKKAGSKGQYINFNIKPFHNLRNPE